MYMLVQNGPNKRLNIYKFKGDFEILIFSFRYQIYGLLYYFLDFIQLFARHQKYANLDSETNTQVWK